MSIVPHCTAVLLNWNGWRDTLACLESLLRADAVPGRIVVCDNGSADDSLARIEAWMRAAPGTHFHATVRTQAQAVGPLDGGAGAGVVDLWLVANQANLGYAGGINVGLRLAMRDGACRLAWILNNDVEVQGDALLQAVRYMAGRPDIGICGSTLVYEHDRRTVQAFGGSSYSRWTGRSRHLGAMATLSEVPEEPQAVESQMACVVGAAMLVRRELLESVGLMTEDYFLYFEEIDWARRAARRFHLGYAARSVVFHKEGATIGTAANGGSPLSLYYLFRNRVRFAWRFHPWHFPAVFLFTCADAAKFVLRARWPQAVAALRGTFQRSMPAGTLRTR
jgi:GT2 family glycosyltransferase